MIFTRSGFTIALLGGLLVFSGVPFPLASQSPGAQSVAAQQDALWKRARTIVSRNASWLPGRIRENEQVFDEQGKLEEKSSIVYGVSARGSRLNLRVLSATTNGRDTRSEKSAELDQSVMAGFLTGGEGNPFDPQLRLTSLKRADRIRVRGVLCREFRFRQRGANNVWAGSVWLDERTGAPVRTSVRGLKEERFAEGAVSNIRFTLNYNANNARWYPLNMHMSYDIRVRVLPLVVFRGTIKSDMRFEEYRRL